MQNMMIAGVLVYGALYTAGVFVAGLMWGNHLAVILALITAGLAYLAQVGGVSATSESPSLNAWYVNVTCMCLSVLVAVAAGITLILGA